MNDKMITKDNFFLSTFADFTPCKTPIRTPDFVSESGSKYWYADNGVIRNSDHWNCKIASCVWLISEESDTGFCKFSDFKKVIIIEESESIVFNRFHRMQDHISYNICKHYSHNWVSFEFPVRYGIVTHYAIIENEGVNYRPVKVSLFKANELGYMQDMVKHELAYGTFENAQKYRSQIRSYAAERIRIAQI